MIRSFRHKGLEAFFTRDDPRKILADRVDRITRLLDRLDGAKVPQDMNLPGWGFHELKGKRKGEYAVSVSGNWRITFRFESVDAFDVNLEDYH
ncbi:MAG: type II toxin-antitoxin system RelE/ParE family toxin [Steroidobacteraceae bacterium]